MTKIVILCGGDSDEREVSLRSGAAVAAALKTSGYEVVSLDPAQPAGDYEQQLSDADVVFPVLHGKGGEDGTIQVWLEARGICYVGADAASSEHCFDKQRFKDTLQQAGLPVPRGELVSQETFAQHELSQKPYVLKPYDGGSSVDTLIVRDVKTADQPAIAAAFGRHRQMLLEELVEGKEITVGIVLDEALPVIEIIPPEDGEFDYENKYNGKTQELCPPQSVSAAAQAQAQELALQIHKLMGVRDMSRTDIIVTDDGSLHVLELNTIPGMTNQSLLPKAARAAGCDMPELCSKLVQAALRRR